MIYMRKTNVSNSKIPAVILSQFGWLTPKIICDIGLLKIKTVPDKIRAIIPVCKNIVVQMAQKSQRFEKIIKSVV